MLTILLLALIYLISPLLFGLIAYNKNSLKKLYNSIKQIFNKLRSNIKQSPYKYISICILAYSLASMVFMSMFACNFQCIIDFIISNVSLVKPADNFESSIFGFSEFISSLALLVVLYTVTGVRYKFRIAVSPIPLYLLTYIFLGVIGFGTLLMDVWFTEQWLMPKILSDHAIFQGIFGAVFFMLGMLWMFFGFIKPPRFSERNYKVFYQKFYNIVLKGSEEELPIIVHELSRSVEALVKLSRPIQTRRKTIKQHDVYAKRVPDVGDYAYDMLLLIGYKKICRHIVASSSVTAILLFKALSSTKKYNLPIGPFAENISTEAIMNKDSILYHEDTGYASGLIGYQKPFSQAVYGDYLLVEGLRNKTTLDISYELSSSWDAEQLSAYARSVLVTFQAYLQGGYWHQHSYALYRSFGTIVDSGSLVYGLDSEQPGYYKTNEYMNYSVSVKFLKDAVNLINKMGVIPAGKFKMDNDYIQKDFYDNIAKHIVETIFYASTIKGRTFAIWSIHYSRVWITFFQNYEEGKAWGIIQFKIRRLLYNQILELSDLPNYKSSRILGLCLHVIGFLDYKSDRHSSYSALSKVVQKWTRNNYLSLRKTHPDIAETCLMGSVTFDEKNSRLVKTYEKGLSSTAPERYLELI
jgi:hypothetical protein